MIDRIRKEAVERDKSSSITLDGRSIKKVNEFIHHGQSDDYMVFESFGGRVIELTVNYEKIIYPDEYIIK